jgi:two-component system sensor histidine kinase DegS
MNTENTSFTNEYRDLIEFIRQMQETALVQSDELLSSKKELEYKKRQQEFLLDEREKQKIPNLSMFSPLSSDDINDDTIYKDDLEEIVSELNSLDEKWKKQNEICQSFERLIKFLSDIEFKGQQSNISTNYSVKLLKTQEMDRNRISRDLHDSTVQSLTSFGHKLEYCTRMVDKDPAKVKLELQSMINTNKEIINDMREIIFNLRPMSLNNIGFVSTVESYCQHLRRNDNLDVVLKITGQEQELSSITSVTLYRILQEACNNSLKHSKASKLYIRISFFDDAIELDVDDNGIGFDLKMVEDRAQEDFLHGFGLSTMRERTKLLSGIFSINTRPGFGTKIHVSVPLDEGTRKEGFYD